MSGPIRNVALLGATGNLGSHILRALTSSNYNVFAIQRSTSTNPVPPPSKSIKLDLSSTNALTAAFSNNSIDAVVSALPNPTLTTEKPWIEAAIAAGVKRIVLSEYSTNLETELSKKLPIVKEKLATRAWVEGLAKEGKVKWSSVNNGPFMVPFIWTSGFIGPNFKTGISALHDGGNRKVGTSTLDRIGEGVAKSLSSAHFAATKNQPIYVYSKAISELEMTKLAEKITGKKFEEKVVSVKEVEEAAFEAFEKGDRKQMMSFYVPFCWGEGYGGDFRSISWNEKFGLEEMGDEEFEGLVRGWLKDAEASSG